MNVYFCSYVFRIIVSLLRFYVDSRLFSCLFSLFVVFLYFVFCCLFCAAHVTNDE